MDRGEQIEAWIRDADSTAEANQRIREIYDVAFWAWPDRADLCVYSTAIERLICAQTVCCSLSEHVGARRIAARWAASAFCSVLMNFERAPAE